MRCETTVNCRDDPIQRGERSRSSTVRPPAPWLRPMRLPCEVHRLRMRINVIFCTEIESVGRARRRPTVRSDEYLARVQLLRHPAFGVRIGFG